MQLRLITVPLLLTLAAPSLLLHSSAPVIAQAPTPTAEEKITEAITLNNNGEGLVYKDLVGLGDLQAGLEMFQQAVDYFQKIQCESWRSEQSYEYWLCLFA
ncbi:MAG: hypothetical protein RMY34_02775 [Aulosira sp. DedQUE10]|nr:hypothetical protein [Aulosira sp. DedQUE10]